MSSTSTLAVLCFLLFFSTIISASHSSTTFFDKYCNPPLITDIGIPIPGASLVQVHLLHRHGDRAPCNLVTVYKDNLTFTCNLNVYHSLAGAKGRFRVQTMTNTNSYRGNCQLGQLTSYGGEQLYNHGAALRALYIEQYKLLHPWNPSPNDIFVHATPDIRTQHSAMSLQNGLYPESYANDDNKRIRFGMQDADYEVLWEPSQCPNVNAMMNRVIDANATYREYVETVMTPQVEELKRDMAISDTLAWELYNNSVDVWGAMYCHRIPLNGTTWEKTNNYAAVHMEYEFMLMTNPNLASWSAAPYLAAMTPYLEAAVGTNQNYPKFLEWSGHDDTMMSVLAGFGLLPSKEWVSYAAHLRTEVWKRESDNTFYARMIYNNDVLPLPCNTNHPTWNGLCTAEDMLALYRSLTPSDWKQRCGIAK